VPPLNQNRLTLRYRFHPRGPLLAEGPRRQKARHSRVHSTTFVHHLLQQPNPALSIDFSKITQIRSQFSLLQFSSPANTPLESATGQHPQNKQAALFLFDGNLTPLLLGSFNNCPALLKPLNSRSLSLRSLQRSQAQDLRTPAKKTRRFSLKLFFLSRCVAPAPLRLTDLGRLFSTLL